MNDIPYPSRSGEVQRITLDTTENPKDVCDLIHSLDVRHGTAYHPFYDVAGRVHLIMPEGRTTIDHDHIVIIYEDDTIAIFVPPPDIFERYTMVDRGEP